jgi:riboflavin kinase/FMN adenylyltransferase
MLGDAADREGFQLSRLDTLRIAGRRVSSGWVREALQNGELDRVAQLIGRPYSILGRVAHGRRLGHSIGFPTANLHVRRKSWPVRGVFAVRVSGVGGRPMDGMANVGTRPTVGGTSWVLEVHLFDFQGELYGRQLGVDFVEKLRDEQRFESVDALKVQLAEDAKVARAALRAAA